MDEMRWSFIPLRIYAESTIMVILDSVKARHGEEHRDRRYRNHRSHRERRVGKILLAFTGNRFLTDLTWVSVIICRTI